MNPSTNHFQKRSYCFMKKLKNGKSVGYDSISNEMIKNSPNCLLDLILDYINLCLQKSLVSETISYDLIAPIFKEGDRSNPDNYRGICISSAILKLITTIISERLHTKVDELKLIDKNQIGFKRNSRTSDHLLTLKPII